MAVCASFNLSARSYGGSRTVFAIGVRCENLEHQEESTNQKDPSLAQVVGILLNVMFLDHLATDIEHLEWLNGLPGDGQIEPSGTDGCEGIRPLSSFLITPSVDLSALAEHHQKDMPYLIQYFVNSLGRDATSCADLMSYFLFTSKYTTLSSRLATMTLTSELVRSRAFSTPLMEIIRPGRRPHCACWFIGCDLCGPESLEVSA